MKIEPNSLTRSLWNRAAKALLVCSIFAVGVVPSAKAQTTEYAYTGNPFTISGSDSITHSNSFSCSGGQGECSLSGYFTVSAPLAAGYSGGITPLSFSFTDGVNTITQAAIASGPHNSASFNITTDADGQIAYWNVGLLDYTSAGVLEITTFNMSGPNHIAYDSSSMGNQQATMNYGYGASSNPGVWVDPPVDNAVTPAPEPSSILLFATGGMVVLGMMALRRKQAVH